MHRNRLPHAAHAILSLSLAVAFFGCSKHTGDAVVIGKEHVAAVPPGGTPQDERATEVAHWIVHVEMIENLRKVNVYVDQPQSEKLKVGDRINVTYSMGKYTGTVWGAEINERR